MTIFGLKVMVKSGLEKIILKFYVPLQRYLLTSQANSALLGRADFSALGSSNSEGALFTITFKPKMVISRLKILVHLFWLF